MSGRRPSDLDPVDEEAVTAESAQPVRFGIRPAVLTIDQAAEYLATTPRHVKRLRAEGRIPFTKVGGRLRFRRVDLDRWLEDNTFDYSD